MEILLMCAQASCAKEKQTLQSLSLRLQNAESPFHGVACFYEDTAPLKHKERGIRADVTNPDELRKCEDQTDNEALEKTFRKCANATSNWARNLEDALGEMGSRRLGTSIHPLSSSSKGDSHTKNVSFQVNK